METTAYPAEAGSMDAWPAWRVFASPATGHCRGHLGELDLAKALFRSAR